MQTGSVSVKMHVTLLTLSLVSCMFIVIYSTIFYSYGMYPFSNLFFVLYLFFVLCCVSELQPVEIWVIGYVRCMLYVHCK